MLTRNDLREFATLKGLTQGNAEKDYVLELALLCLSRIIKDELIFKGGTALYKFYKLDRFSEDLDFSLHRDVDVASIITKLISALNRFSLNTELLSMKTFPTSITAVLRSEGPLYTGNPQSYSKIQIDINLKSEVLMKVSPTKLISLYPTIPTFTTQVMNIEEIFAEKIRAALTRDKARDVYDIWFLTLKQIPINLHIINAKLDYYNIEFDINEFEISVLNNEKTWERDLHPLIQKLPPFEKIYTEIIKYLKKELIS